MWLAESDRPNRGLLRFRYADAQPLGLEEDGRAGIIRAFMRSDVPQILKAIDDGAPGASEALLPLVVEDLRKLAARRLAKENAGQTLQATALVHEAYARLVGSDDKLKGRWDSRSHFFAAAAEVMRRILVDRARSRKMPKTRRS